MQNEINKTLQILKNGGIILYPTDTVWGIGCDATNPEAVKKVYNLKNRIDSKALICLVADDRMLKQFVKVVPDTALNIIDIAEKPTTIIYDDAKNLAHNLIADDGSIAIRIPADDFCYWVSRKLNGPLVSTSANISGAPTPKSFKEISDEILKGVDYVVNLQHEKICNKPSSIIKISNSNVVKIIRE
ncbi:threonylcarbamoyl-AMP synthase [Algibacter amylolyticus]|uniref:L-threonylcarbamoyladenylate synthase n=1 Tax=Algibacter amylolyticus TaxID=1608400 RepID=A0A5M7BAF8_9FLAO|nr:L-threonylcarbamoyladenylate synthase [Algibacter amylolyticus]KAA5824421.1 threonylcarbamoyl-AMP synthase [Algibacter amylolyticus]MBB5269521.1 L-threonylcarbamoyladenylate synthase [Algibacter amylolyticus]TSJ75194.1 threonylcarbamoyl-AMP synthase [Algibacter amylolyticus]